MKSILFCALSIALFHGAAWAAEPAEVSEEGFRYTKAYYDDTVAEDGTELVKTAIGIKVLRADAVEGLKEYPISYSTSAEKVDIVEAYTLKPDGRRVDAAKNSFQVSVAGGRDGAPPAFSDESTVTVVFPDVAVGDTVNVVYNRAVFDPLFPKHFSDIYTFSRRVLYDDVRVSYSIPLSLNARFKNYGLTETENRKDKDRQYLAWSFKNATVEKIKYTVPPVSEVGDVPTVTVSTFPSYQAMAEAYGARAKEKAVVTDEIQKIADSATKGITEPKEQARALYNWVIENLTYAGNCIGVGAVVPRDLDFVLKNKMGDCKDHATLLQTLLKAKGIESTQALIGVNNMYKLPEIPTVSVVNHVINYIPAFDLYLDATSGMPFDTLPFQMTGKPVLLVDGFKEGSTTPKREPGQIGVTVEGEVTIAADGSAEGTMKVSMASPEGGSHYALQQLEGQTAKKLEEAAEGMLKMSGFQGSVTMERTTWDEKTMTLGSSMKYKLKDYIRIGSPGAIYAAPPFSPQPLARATSMVVAAKAQKDAINPPHGFVCSDSRIVETYKYVFPPDLKILAVPDNVSAKNSVQDYESKYVLEGQTLTVTRSMKDTSPIPLCASEINDLYAEIAEAVWKDVKSQIVYK